MASVYLLHSDKLNRFYIGSCDDLSIRIDQHLNKEFLSGFTAKADDWTLFYFKDGLTYKQARKIEAHLKKMRNKTYFMNLKKYPEIMEILKEKFP